ncbi:MAG TPA: cytochrome o ubiquinol oxidase subunit IV [Chlamydiales bacterium]|nr:cytochrome o ubiquinol oxidase subunit IV [Chlamydiales bacterium]
MDHDPHATIAAHTTLKSYLIGLVISLILTLASYFVVTEQLFTRDVIIYTICGFGFVQALVQLYYFLHLGQESKPHWNMIVFLFMAMVLAIVVVGSLWIMNHLNYNMTPTIDVEAFLRQQRGL